MAVRYCHAADMDRSPARDRKNAKTGLARPPHGQQIRSRPLNLHVGGQVRQWGRQINSAGDLEINRIRPRHGVDLVDAVAEVAAGVVAADIGPSPEVTETRDLTGGEEETIFKGFQLWAVRVPNHVMFPLLQRTINVFSPNGAEYVSPG
jgi:hypothetical protein